MIGFAVNVLRKPDLSKCRRIGEPHDEEESVRENEEK